jgi:hypothetical protein
VIDDEIDIQALLSEIRRLEYANLRLTVERDTALADLERAREYTWLDHMTPRSIRAILDERDAARRACASLRQVVLLGIEVRTEEVKRAAGVSEHEEELLKKARQALEQAARIRGPEKE